ncbi:MAG: hypothetical protein Athens101428_83 [Candidatus Berkelbacteria bacterium Athens1014_28]|uniref:Restriction endonuclease n=1 Tax=Candidatus Berkelbacteria bacterium Athens1014_28 TaxID=2017145 RepID=A0A554LQ07_9BACT|nr:MAG: hypothetical protein Athens101428_83 [Candidatus Berkelbacteria bacterium Athens1014_28]
MKISEIILKKIAEIKKRKPPQKFDWAGSLYEDTQFLTIDERGQLGEEIAVDILKSFKSKVHYDSSITEETKGWDFVADGLKIETKLATITIGSGLFQHENIHPQRDFDGILFIDLAPNEIYLTAVCKKDINWKELHRRENGVYKCDFSIDHIKGNKIAKFKKYKTGLVNSAEDFFEIYKWLEGNCK